MTFRICLFSFLFFISCGERRSKDVFGDHQLSENEIRHSNLSSRDQNEIIKKLNVLKANLPGMSEAQINEQIVSLLLRMNELYEKMYTVELFTEGQYSRVYSQKDIDFRLQDISEKYQALRKIGIKDPKTIPFQKNLIAIVKAQRDFGDLYLKETLRRNGESKVKSIASVNTPWSGHWYPLTKTTMYEGADSPLGKFDALVKAVTGKESKIRMSQELRTKDTASSLWEGYCDAWSLASILTQEPLQSVKISGVTLEPRHLKGLYTFYHLSYTYEKYGFTYKGSRETDGTYQDVNPEVFHKVITEVIGKQGRAVVIDAAAGVEAWNKPMFAYTWSVVKDSVDEKNPKNIDGTPYVAYPDHAYKITGFAKIVEQRNEETNEPTNSKDHKFLSLSFRVFVDKTKIQNGGYKVLLAEWIQDSERNHPDNIKVPHKESRFESFNEEFVKHVDVFKTYLLKRI